jgi:coproporphyrinogen III oxidase
LDNGTHWFGGGIDLTPHYVIPEHAQIFHQRLKGICDKYDRAFYPRFKEWADDYFYIPHRQETRGIGGVFYDHIAADWKHSKTDLLAFATDLGEAFPFIYEEQASFGRDKAESEAEKRWQGLRRGRYVEFNLVNDRGTKFGLLSGGRTESILMSMPPLANWEYNIQPDPNSPEGETIGFLKSKQVWL